MINRIQRGTTNFLGPIGPAPAGSYNVPLSSVNTGKSFIKAAYRTMPEGSATARLTSSTNMNISLAPIDQGYYPGGLMDWEVIEFQ